MSVPNSYLVSLYESKTVGSSGTSASSSVAWPLIY